MARSCGLRIGPRRFELVVLDGGAKKHRIVAYHAGEFDPNAEDPHEEVRAVLKDAVKQFSVPKDNVGLVIDTGLAAFRRMTLPVTDASKIEQVLKFEVEGELPQWNIDDVVVDFHVLGETGDTSDLLVTAVPKDDLRPILEDCEASGVEPLEAEVEATAMVNAAMAADLCRIDDAQLLVHVGDRSTAVVVMDAGEVREMRSIHMGALTHEALPGAEPVGEDEEDGEAAEAAPVDPIEASRRLEQVVKRVRRELGRTLSAARTIHSIDSIYVCGSELPGLIGDTVLDVPVYVLDCFEQDSGQPADGFGQLVAAYGAALRQLGGGVLQPSLRREELKFTGTWERIEFPLAIAAMLLFTLTGFVYFLEYKEIRMLENSGSLWHLRSANRYVFGEPTEGKVGFLANPPAGLREKYMEPYVYRKGQAAPEADYLALMDELRGKIDLENLELKKRLGQASEVQQPQSAFVATTLVLDVLKQMQDVRPSLRRIKATYQEPRNAAPHVTIQMDVVFFADSSTAATEKYYAFGAELAKNPWLLEYAEKATSELPNGKGIIVNGQTIKVDVSKWSKDGGS